MSETVAVNTNFSSRVAVRVQDNLFTYRAAKMWNDLPADNIVLTVLNILSI